MILVSHDRAFLRELATRVWAFDGDRIEDFNGPFVDWEAMARERAGRRRTEQNARDSATRDRTRADTKKTADTKRDDGGDLRTARRAAEAGERDVQSREARVAELQAQLADPSLYDGGAKGAKRAAALSADLKAATRDHEAAFLRWSEAMEKLTALEGARAKT